MIDKGYSELIPNSWKEWYVLFNGISSGLVKVNGDNIIVEDNTIESTIPKLNAELRLTAVDCIPNVAQECAPKTALLLIASAATKILRSIPQNCLIRENNFFNEVCFQIADECRMVCDISEIFQKYVLGKYKEDLSEDWSIDYPLFSKNQLNELFKYCNGKIFAIKTSENEFQSTMEDFLSMINAPSNYLCYEDDLFSSRTIRFKKGHGMSAYCFLLALSICKQREESDETSWSEDFNEIIDWSEYTCVKGTSSWVSNYRDTIEYFLSPIDKIQIEQQDKILYSEFIGRPVFEDVFSNDFIAVYVESTYVWNEMFIRKQQSNIQADRLITLKRILSCLIFEENFLLRNKDAIIERFKTKDEATMIHAMLVLLEEESQSYFRELNKYFETEEGTIVELLYRKSNTFGKVSDKPIISKDTISAMLDGCILQIESVKEIIKQYIIEETILSSLTPIAKEVKRDAVSEAKRWAKDGKTTGDFQVLVPLSGFARDLVAKGFVKPPKNWPDEFSKYRYLDSLPLEICKKIAGKLNWKPFDFFKDYNGNLMSDSVLRNHFAQGDSEWKKRAEAINAIFHIYIEKQKEKMQK